MKILRHKIATGLVTGIVILGLLNISLCMDKLALCFPDINISSLLAEELKENFDHGEDGFPDNSAKDSITIDWLGCHSLAFKLCQQRSSLFNILTSRNIDNVHLDRFTPPPEPC